jgi:ABC-2 type transport system ATP-binding protein
MDEAEQCQSLALIQDGRLVVRGSPQEIKLHEMRGEVLEVDCDRPDLAIPILRELHVFQEVTLYGAQIHVVSEEPARHRQLIAEALEQRGVRVAAVERIVPSLEDVFISTVRRQEKSVMRPKGCRAYEE